MLEMRRQDQEELYQLLLLYVRTYGSQEAEKLLMELKHRYASKYHEDISLKRNPRNAGRKRCYTDSDKEKIHKLRGEGNTLRKISEKTGCSVGYIQGVLSEP